MKSTNSIRFGGWMLLAGALTLTGCKRPGRAEMDFRHNPEAKGTAVLKFGNDSVTVEQLSKRFGEMRPHVKAQVQTPDQRKAYAEQLGRFELLAAEAVRQGLANDPEVVEAAKKVLVQKVLWRQAEIAAPSVGEDEIAAYYKAHAGDYAGVERWRLAHVFFAAGEKDASRADKRKRAEAALSAAKRMKPDDFAAFAGLAKAASEEPRTQPLGGDMRFLTLDDLMKQYGAAVAAAAKPLETAGALHPTVVETPLGFHVLKLMAKERSPERTLEQVRGQIEGALLQKKRTKVYESFIDGLKKTQGFSIDEKALAEVKGP
ncbi:MAG: peptidylprolyl isomerase [Myxococcaceae bacterium]